MGRLVIKVGASYKADPEQVMKILAEVAAKNTLILQHPKPVVAFEDLGPSALEFSLRVLLADINKGLEAQTQLRLDIFKSFRAEGIEIPYAQHDVHLRDLDGAREALSTALAARKREQEREAAE
jgi:potassium-dependent mechanosensitive channel